MTCVHFNGTYDKAKKARYYFCYDIYDKDVPFTCLLIIFVYHFLFPDWTVCPFAHAGEKAVRRDPRTVDYTGIACPDMKKGGSCIRGEKCPYAHNVFEYWLHPTRYRTQLCNDGPGCRRGICFFAHSLDELRVPANKPYVSPEALARASIEAIQNNPHPLGDEVPLDSCRHVKQSFARPNNQPNAQLLDSTAIHQQAALAALNGGIPLQLSSGMSISEMNPMVEENMPYTHVAPNPPRLSKDYGSLPRWSNNHGFNSICRSSLGSMPGTPQFQGLRQKPVRYSASAVSLGSGGSDEEGSVPNCLVNENTGYHSTNKTQIAETSGLYSCTSAKADGMNNSGSNTMAAMRNLLPSDTKINDDQLAQSLAALKIALTQQTAAQSTASNHEVVIATLHQLLQDAVMRQNDGSGEVRDTNPSDNSQASRVADLGPQSKPIHRIQSNESGSELSNDANRCSYDVRSSLDSDLELSKSQIADHQQSASNAQHHIFSA